MITRARNEKKFRQRDDRIPKAKRADTAALEREIDERVYRLYGLTAEEIKLVEEAGK
jgi:adenine-specific DNA-methyltransferase